MADLATDSVQQVTTVDSSGSSNPKLLNSRGTHAQFLRENPRFLNDPICHVVPSETSRDVEECLSWGVATTRAKPATRSAAVPCMCFTSFTREGEPVKGIHILSVQCARGLATYVHDEDDEVTCKPCGISNVSDKTASSTHAHRRGTQTHCHTYIWV